MADDDASIAAALDAVRDSLHGVRAVALMLTGAGREEIDLTALMLMVAETCERADRSVCVVAQALQRPPG